MTVTSTTSPEERSYEEIVRKKRKRMRVSEEPNSNALGLTKSNRKALERMQKMAVRVIMGKQFQSYRKSLKALNIDTLEVRREKLCLSFAKKCVQHEKLKHWFPLNNLKGRNMKTRKSEKFKVLKGSTDRYKKSAIPYMRRLLNDDYLKKIKHSFMIFVCYKLLFMLCSSEL